MIIRFFKTGLSFVMPRLVVVMGLALLAWVAARAVMDPLMCWDPWMYHIPFAILLWNIGGGSATTRFTDDAFMRVPFGIIGEWFQGGLWQLFGSANFVSLVNIIPFYTALFLAWRWLGVSWIFLALAALSMPMIAIHATSAYIDLMMGSFLLIAVIAGLTLIKQQSLSYRKNAWVIAWLCVSVIIAGNAKFTTLPPIAAILAVTFFKIWRTDLRLRAGLTLLILMLSGVGAAGNMIDNYILYKNPVYPFTLNLPGGIAFKGTRYDQPHDPPSYLQGSPFPRAFHFLLSVTEIDWLIDPPNKIFYSEASQAADARAYGVRTGGLLLPVVMAQLLFAGIGAYVLRRRVGYIVEKQLVRDGFYYFGAITLAYMIQPDAYEVRYSLAWPLTLNLVCALLFGALIRRNWMHYFVLLLMFASLVVIQLFVPMQRSLFSTNRISYYPDAVRKRLDPELMSFIEKHGGACLAEVGGVPYSYDYFGWCPVSMVAYTAAFTGGDYKIEFSDCTMPKPPAPK